ncbi:3-keto-5-aminohexanoate cleavage protein [Mesorhizobium sp.]|uniref:3-keto-5-aminohexanoate cleavage protein n=1 Tax=Mesorhizobium sp. TaxID=1871066 RepID=UPI000FE78FA0|nr:3-keto-5-aminohexanoate cleavage protein [Mesorhizobium sp.]RWB53943.1 MAG: 3-keto-5-aminohexanoate cleavage protein [Mesorhizobium sp.]RWD93528.1 MAG: 3-keto-5-aminohexanoate cleavage protein [Mesorhizobium sp.]TIV53312.1 MAG: 3-keto-5-aminohexanoate cleavage protein [Mesorhizobium sp.]TKB12894.1 MAG: 3-keto-5-aminohexanoate cleavage protein [Mesorhizobium sp.]
MLDQNSVAIAVAPNGGRRTKADHPALPIAPDELADAAAASLDAGAAMIHVHVRDRGGQHLLDTEAYRAATTAIRTSVGDRLVLQITSEALGIYRPEQQMRVVLEVRPEAVSLALRELVPDQTYEAAFAAFLETLRREKVTPQIILYTPEEATYLAALAGRGLIPFDNLPVLHVLGRYTVGQTSRPADLLPFLAPGIAAASHWMVCAFGGQETACVTAAALLGGHARVGFENNLFLPNGALASGNQDLVAAAKRAIEACGLPLADADALRGQWGAA